MDFDYDNIPDTLHVNALPAQFTPQVLDLMAQAIEEGWPSATETKAAYLYDRKGYLYTDDMNGERNKSYGKESDDILLQVSIRIPNYGYDKLDGFIDSVKKFRADEEVDKLNKLIARAEADRKAAQDQLDRLMGN